MARNIAKLLILLYAVSICNAVTIPGPITDSHRSVALELFDGLSSGLEDAYEALRVFEVLAIEKKSDLSTTTCQKVVENLGSSSPLKDLFYALKVNDVLKCNVDRDVFKGIASRLKATVKDASTLIDIYYTIGSLVLIKDQAPDVDVLLADADGTFHSIKALSQSDGRWRYSSDNPESSTHAAGLALEALAGVVSLASSEIDQSRLILPHGHAFKPHQALLKLRHETKYEHVFVVGNTGKKFEIILDFLGLVEKFYYLSGRYDIELTVGDAVMENSFLRPLGHVELDLPEAPEKAARLPPLPVDPYSRYGPKAEITHLFRAPEKRPPQKLSLAFLILIFLPLIGLLVGLLCLGVNFKNFPSSAVPAIYAILFHFGIAAVLLLYVLFWLKLDLFTTLKTLGFLGAFLMFVGHRILSHLASTSAKLKSA